MVGEQTSDRAALEIVFVCTGNRARSPLAEALLRRAADGLPLDIRSRGTSDVGKAPALPEMIATARTLGIDLGGHRATVLRRGELRDAMLVVGFEPIHVAAAVIEGGARTEVAFTLPELVRLTDGPPRGRPAEGPLSVQLQHDLRAADARRSTADRLSAPGIPDPLGRSRRTFDAVAAEIAALVERLAGRLFGPPPGDAR